MTTDRIASLRRMVDRTPDDPRAHFGLALELEKEGAWVDVVTHLRRYLDLTSDEGNAWGRLGNALHQLGLDEDAKTAYRTGIDVANRHGHPTMAMEFEEVLADWD